MSESATPFRVSVESLAINISGFLQQSDTPLSVGVSALLLVAGAQMNRQCELSGIRPIHIGQLIDLIRDVLYELDAACEENTTSVRR